MNADDDRLDPDPDTPPTAAGSAGSHATGPTRNGDERPLGLNLLTWLYWFWAGAVTLMVLGLAFGEGPVPLSGETVPRPVALRRVLPVLVPMGLAVIGAALALVTRRTWARAAVLLPVVLAAFGPALSGVARSAWDVVFGVLALLPVLAGLVWYLYYVPRIRDYFRTATRDGS